jgi:hypothetical protein
MKAEGRKPSGIEQPAGDAPDALRRAAKSHQRSPMTSPIHRGRLITRQVNLRRCE